MRQKELIGRRYRRKKDGKVVVVRNCKAGQLQLQWQASGRITTKGACAFFSEFEQYVEVPA